jgi:putative membrane protein
MFIARVIINMVAIMIIAYLFPGIMRVDGFGAALAASFILGIINAIIRPILIFLTLPLTVVTFGFFLLILNGLLLGLVSYFVPGFYISGLGGAILGSLLISFVSWVLAVNLTPRSDF